MVDLTPYIIQSYFDKLDTLKYKVTRAVAIEDISGDIPNIAKLARRLKISEGNISRAIARQGITVRMGRLIAKGIKKDMDDIFEIKTTEKKYGFETISKHKRCLRSILATSTTTAASATTMSPLLGTASCLL